MLMVEEVDQSWPLKAGLEEAFKVAKINHFLYDHSHSPFLLYSWALEERRENEKLN